jgi:hypothetical protein
MIGKDPVSITKRKEKKTIFVVLAKHRTAP